MLSNWKILFNWAETLGVNLTSEKAEQFQIYYQLLLDWNKKINLISRQDINRIIGYHFIDSISALPEIPEKSVICDLGTGAGLPGIPIKILRDDIALYLVESIKKKASFLCKAVKELNLDKTVILNQRAETIKDIKFDIILVRLLGKIFDVLPVVSKLLSHKGKLIFFKSINVMKEIDQATEIADRYNLKLLAIKNVKLPITDILRKLIIFIPKN